MRKYKNICTYIFICLFFISSVSTSYGQENSQIKPKDLQLNGAVHYEDENYLYFKIDEQIARLKKDFTGDYQILSEEEKNYIEKVKSNEKSFNVKGMEIDNKDIKIKGDYLYYNELKLLDIKKYIDEDNEFYIQNPNSKRVPMSFYLRKYILSDNKTMYLITIYTCNAISAPYTPMYQNYVMIDQDVVKELKLSMKNSNEEISEEVTFELENVYLNNNTVWLVGYHYYSWHSIFDTSVYYIDQEGNLVCVDEIVNNLDECIKDKNEQLALRLVGMNEKRVVLDNSEKYNEGQNIYYKLNDLYEINEELEIKRITVDKSIVNERYVKESDVFYLGKENEIYYISNKPNGVVNLTSGKFKKFNLNNNEVNEKTGEDNIFYIPIIINGEYIEFNHEVGYPFIDENNRTQVPFRAILEKIGATIEWNNEKRSAIGKKEGIEVEVPIDKSFIIKNGERIQNDTKALVKDNRIYLPMRVLLEAFEYKVEWNGSTIKAEL